MKFNKLAKEDLRKISSKGGSRQGRYNNPANLANLTPERRREISLIGVRERLRRLEVSQCDREYACAIARAD